MVGALLLLNFLLLGSNTLRKLTPTNNERKKEQGLEKEKEQGLEKET